jgi:hypothetical protein
MTNMILWGNREGNKINPPLAVAKRRNYEGRSLAKMPAAGGLQQISSTY